MKGLALLSITLANLQQMPVQKTKLRMGVTKTDNCIQSAQMSENML